MDYIKPENMPKFKANKQMKFCVRPCKLYSNN